MATIRSHRYLSLLFKLSNYTGIWIPANLSTHKRSIWPKVWEVTLFLSIFISMCLIMHILLSVMSNRVTSVCQPAVTFIIYFLVLIKDAYFLVKKEDLLRLFKKMDGIVNFHPFANQQEAFLDETCQRIRKTLLALIVLSNCCCFVMLLVFGKFDRDIKEKIALGANLTEGEKLTLEVIKSGNFTMRHFFIFGMNAAWSFILPIKNVVMDAFMLLCHTFVIQQLRLLERNFNQSAEKGARKIAYVYNQREKHNEQWILMFNKVKRFVSIQMLIIFIVSSLLIKVSTWRRTNFLEFQFCCRLDAL